MDVVGTAGYVQIVEGLGENWEPTEHFKGGTYLCPGVGIPSDRVAASGYFLDQKLDSITLSIFHWSGRRRTRSVSGGLRSTS